MDEIRGIAVMSSWNTDGGVTRHITPLVEWLISHGYKVKVFTHYRECTHGEPLDVEDEDFVVRCFTLEGKDYPGLNSFNYEPLMETLEEDGYNVFLAEDIGMLPFEKLLKIFPRIKKNAKTILVNHDNKPKPSDHPLWNFDWDTVVNFLPEQDEFIKEHYKNSYLTVFPTYPFTNINIGREETCRKLNLPEGKNIIITFGEYDFVAPSEALNKLREEDSSVYLIALVYDEKGKNILEEELRKRGYEKTYDEIRVEKSSWQKRMEYVIASSIVVLDKGMTKGEGAVLSSTAFQVIGWGTPILVRSNAFFEPFGDAVVKYKDNEKLLNLCKKLLKDKNKKEKILVKAYAFALTHSPQRVATQLLCIFNDLLNPVDVYPCKRLERRKKEPLIKPREDAFIEIGNERIRWEKLVYNAAAFRLKGTTYVVYRALGEDGIARMGLWWSSDGIKEEGRLSYPIFGPKEDYELPHNLKARQEEQMKGMGMIRETGGTEDPRITLIEDYLYMTYTAYGETAQFALARIKVKGFLEGVKSGKWEWERNGPIFEGIDDKDGIIFSVFECGVQQKENGVAKLFPELFESEIALIHRVPPDMQIFCTKCSKELGETFMMPKPYAWDNEKIGAGAPPLRTRFGLLHVYHGVGGWKGKKAYRLGVILTDLNSSKIKYRSPNPILEPTESYEVEGWVPNVVFTCGVVPRYKDSNEILDENDEILVYYGAADEVIGVASAKGGDLIPEEVRKMKEK